MEFVNREEIREREIAEVVKRMGEFLSKNNVVVHNVLIYFDGHFWVADIHYDLL